MSSGARRLPAAAGLGFKPRHFADIVRDPHPPAFFEIHAENYMDCGGPMLRQLDNLRSRAALSIHGVALSIGGSGPLDRDHLARLRALCDAFEPESFSEHLAWSSHDGAYFADLLPLPYTKGALDRIVAHIAQTQDALARPMLLENPATYVVFEESTIDEVDFLAEIAARSGCGLLLDINNVHVSAHNHGGDARAYLDRFPLALVGEIHLAGHAPDPSGLLIDAHDRAVDAEVWALLDHVLDRAGPKPVLVEWDNDVPEWPVLRDEAQRAQRAISASGARHALR